MSAGLCLEMAKARKSERFWLVLRVDFVGQAC